MRTKLRAKQCVSKTALFLSSLQRRWEWLRRGAAATLMALTLACQTMPSIETKRSDGTKTDKATTGQNTTQGARATQPSSSIFSPEDDYEDTRVNPPVIDEPEEGAEVTPQPARTVPPVPKVGIIIGPGFMRSFLAAGILQEFHKARVPVQGLIGFEWGSMPAALYSMNGQANEVEWQMLKLNESSVLKKSLIRTQIEPQSVAELQDFLNQAFGRRTFDQGRLPFECLTFDFKKKQYFWMKKGEVGKALSYCLASPPFSKPYLNNVGAADLKLAAENLRQKGANYIVFINLMSGNKNHLDENFSSEAQVLWALKQYEMMKTNGIIDFVVDTSAAPYSPLDFGARREMIRKGQEIGTQAIKKLSNQLGI